MNTYHYVFKISKNDKPKRVLIQAKNGKQAWDEMERLHDIKDATVKLIKIEHEDGRVDEIKEEM